MKTPMQELLEGLIIDKNETKNKSVKLCLEGIIEHILSDLVSYEKEAMVGFAYKCRNVMAADEFAISKWYDETFNTKEK